MQDKKLHNIARNELGNFLDTQHWDLWCTFTTLHELTLSGARRAIIRFTNNLHTSKNLPITIFWASEKFDLKDGFHMHGLIRFNNVNEWKGNTREKFKEVVNTWQVVNNTKLARFKGERFDKGRGAGSYLTKYITKEITDYDLMNSQSENMENIDNRVMQFNKPQRQQKAKKKLQMLCKIHNTNLEIENKKLFEKPILNDIQKTEKEIYGYTTN
jgi:hypothetical protein